MVLKRNQAFLNKNSNMAGKDLLYNVIFKTCWHFDQNENYKNTSHVYLFKKKKTRMKVK